MNREVKVKRDDLDQLASALGGLSILGCLPGSPGARAGLTYGDVLLEVNGTPTPDLGSYMEAIRDRTTNMTLRVFRQGQEQVLQLDLDPAPEQMNPAQLVRQVLKTGVLPAHYTLPVNDEEPLN